MGSVTWLGHATAVIDIDGVRLLTDPLLRDRVGALVRVAGARPPDEDVAGIDAVLLSHLHYDHVDLPSLERIAPSAAVIAPRGAGAWLTAHGVHNVRELAVGAEAEVGALRVTATRAAHDGRRRPFGLSADAIGFVVRGSRSVYFAGDTGLFPEMSAMAGQVDAALLPVWGWGRTLGPGHLDPQLATIAASLIAPRLAIPIHWGTFAPWPRPLRPTDLGKPAREFVELVSRLAIDVDVRVLAPGESTVVAARPAS